MAHNHNHDIRTYLQLAQRNSLWIASIGLMLASSGIDGAYLAKLMTPALGYTLNTISDITTEVLMYWFGRLRQEPKGTKKHKFSIGLLPAIAAMTFYAWLFGWRQLLPILMTLETKTAAQCLAPVTAGFVPIALLAASYTQALMAGRFTDAATTSKPFDELTTKPQQPQQADVADAAVPPTIADYRDFITAKSQENGNGATTTRETALQWATDAGMDVTAASGKDNRDKVLRWWRTVTQ